MGLTILFTNVTGLIEPDCIYVAHDDSTASLDRGIDSVRIPRRLLDKCGNSGHEQTPRLGAWFSFHHGDGAPATSKPDSA